MERRHAEQVVHARRLCVPIVIQGRGPELVDLSVLSTMLIVNIKLISIWPAEVNNRRGIKKVNLL